MNFKKVLSEKRFPVPTPESIIDEQGRAVFGTFESEFKDMDFVKIKGQSKVFPDFLNKLRLTLWEAIEINLKDCMILTAVCDMGVLAKAITCFYDKRNGKLTYWAKDINLKDAYIAPTLLNGDTTESTDEDIRVKCVNHFERGNAYITGNAFDSKKGFTSYDFELSRVSLPSIVSIPFAENKPLYTQKDLFSVKGWVEFNGERFETDENSTAIIDDHRGYYPYIAHYDWVTTMGKMEIDGKEQFFGINLTRNQSVNQHDYNENLIWFEGKTSRVTPVRFEHIEYNKWRIKDAHGMVDIIFDIKDRYILRMPYVVIDVKYHIVFGQLSGYICDEDGNKYVLDGWDAIGEDKSLRF